MISAQVIIGFLVLLLAYNWLKPSPRGSSLGFPITSPDRLAAYEEIWRREESELWDWLEDRVGIDGNVPVARYGDQQQALRQKSFAKKLKKQDKEGTFNKAQVDDAIRVTEERLGALKEAVERNKQESVRNTEKWRLLNQQT